MSGSGNVSTYAIEKLLDLGAIPVTASDSTGYGEPSVFHSAAAVLCIDTPPFALHATQHVLTCCLGSASWACSALDSCPHLCCCYCCCC